MGKNSLRALLFLLALANCGKAAEPALSRFSYAEKHMGTLFRIVLYAPDEATAKQAAQAGFERIQKLDNIMTDYRTSSELMQLCKKAGGPPVKVSDDLFAVLARAREVSRLSDGAFDVTVGPVVRLWRVARKTGKMPAPDQLAQARMLVGYRNIELDPQAGTVKLRKAGMLLDLGGIGKGYAADAVLELLKQRGITRALVAAGGDIAVSDPPPGKKGWTVGIAPLNPNQNPSRFLILANAAVSTSGEAEQHVVIDGKRYSHIVNPHTGIGLVGQMSVTVVAANGKTADPMTKVVSILGAKEGLKIIDSLPAMAALIVRKTDTGVENVESKRFKDLPQKTGKAGTP